jgi:glucuronosyltransferase
LLFTNAAKILGVYTSFSRSHAIIGQSLFKALARRGHEVSITDTIGTFIHSIPFKVTVISPYPLDKPMKNYQDVTIPITVDHESFIGKFIENSGNMVKFLMDQQELVQLTMKMANDSLNSPQFQRLMREETFELVILGYFVNDFLVGLAPHFKCPMIVVSSTGTLKVLNDFVGNPTSVAGTSHLLTNINGPMTFMQRVKNMVFIIMEYVASVRMAWKAEALYNANFPADKYPPYDVVRRNTSLVFANSHFCEGRIQPNLPSLVEVGGLQIKQIPDPLPQNIKRWLDEAKHGVILFSLGSNVKSTLLPDEKLKIFLDTFAKLKQRVLWKWEADELPVKLDNVMTSKWLPQDDILAHENVKLFITHGGKGSLAECMFHGVPILGIPFFGDQMVNIDAAVLEGWALRVDYAILTHENFYSAIQEMLQNTK